MQREKRITLTSRYILVPIRNEGDMACIDVCVDGRTVREFDARIAESEDAIDFWSFLDATPFNGNVATIKIDGAARECLEMIVQGDEIPGEADFYNEPLRPQFHFSQKVGWSQDPNGLIYYEGDWHLYFQYNPYSVNQNEGNSCWGHAVSRDLIHWEHLPIAMYNRTRKDWAFSGHAIVDHDNAGGWQTGDEKVIVVSWTSSGRGQCISYSNDRGRTFTEYEGNPVIPDPSARDPKSLWYEPEKHWVMVVCEKHEVQCMAFYTSTNLKNWNRRSLLKDWGVCPELFELPVDGDSQDTRWVVFAFDSNYAIGRFDGEVFTPDHEDRHKVHFGNTTNPKGRFCFRASQVFTNVPDGRTIQMGWDKIWMPGMPFNQAFSFPHELTLRTTEDGIRMFAEPIEEIETIYRKSHSVETKPLSDARPFRIDVSGDIFDLTATFDVGDAKTLRLDIGGNRIEYDVEAGTLMDAPLKPADGKLTIRALVDRPMLEIYGNHGRVIITIPREVTGEVGTVKAFAAGGAAELEKMTVNELESIWR